MKHTKADDVDGWLIIDKPQGMTCTQVVGKTRYLLHANKNGHTGTLDPFATGVLPIAFGEATKLVPYVTDGKNVAAIPHFIGKIKQIPPIYSAIKINGQQAYKLARKGQNVDMPEREIEIYALELLDEYADSAKFRVECSKGTYVRTLGHDLAIFLGTVGHLTELRRTKCGNFSLEHKILLDSLEKMEYVDKRRKSLLPMETSLRDIAEIAVSAEDAIKLSHGQGLSPKNYANFPQGSTLKAMFDDCLIALVRIDEHKISPIRVFQNNNKKEI